jgi:hypothetical protein
MHGLQKKQVLLFYLRQKPSKNHIALVLSLMLQLCRSTLTYHPENDAINFSTTPDGDGT